MAQEAVNTILQAFQRGMEQVQQVRTEEERASEFAREQKLREDQFKASKEAADRLYDLQQAQFEANRAQQQYQNLQTFQQTGVVPPGAVVTPGLPSSTMGTRTPVAPSQLPIGGVGGTGTGIVPNPQGPLTQTGVGLENTLLTYPGGGMPQSVPPLEQSPMAMLARAQAADAITNKVKEAQAVAPIELQSKLALEDALTPKQMAFEKLKNDNALAIERMRSDAQRADNALTNSTRLRIAAMNRDLVMGAGGALGMDADGNIIQGVGNTSNQLTERVRGVVNGTITQEDLAKMYPNAKARQAFMNTLPPGITPMNNKQRDRINDLQAISPLVQQMDIMYQNLNDHPFKLQVPSKESSAYDNARQIVEANRAQFVRIIESTNRYTHQQAEDVVKELIPDASLKTVAADRILGSNAIAAQNAKYDFFVRHQLQDAINVAIGDRPIGQQTAIRGRVGLPDLREVMTEPGATHPTTTGMTTPTVNPGEERIPVYDSKTKQKVTQLKKFIDANPSRYRILKQGEY